MMSRVGVAIMAKAPAAGGVKTRLCPPLSGAEAAALYRCFLLDKIRQVQGLRDARPAIAYTPVEERPVFEALAPGVGLIAQRGMDLGERLRNCLDELLRDGCGGAMAIDSDTPTLPLQYLQEGVDLMARATADLVLGPTEDGGYYLIGVREPHPELFEAIPWSTAGVLAATIQRAEAKGLRIACLPRWFDVDTPQDLARLKASLESGAGSSQSHTARFFRETEPGAKPLSEAPWTTLSTKPVYENRWLSLREDLVELPDGRTTIYGVVTTGPCVGILPFLDLDTVLLVRQYRYVARRMTWEMPTGGVHAGESVEDAAQRELAEESGYRAGRLTPVGIYHTSKSVMDETAYLFLGEDLVRATSVADETEFIEARPFPFDDALRMVLSGEIVDSMTIIAVLRADRMRRGRAGDNSSVQHSED
jgi:rSAM/selenodomain-associated transferase 1